MKINGIEFEFNATKLDGMKKLEEAMDIQKPKLEKSSMLMAEGKYYQGAKMQIEATSDFFKHVAGKDIVGDCDDVALVSAFLEDFNRQVEEQKKKVKEEYYKRR